MIGKYFFTLRIESSVSSGRPAARHVARLPSRRAVTAAAEVGLTDDISFTVTAAAAL